MIVCMIASEFSPVVRVLRWERNLDRGDRDRRQGWYMRLCCFKFKKGKSMSEINLLDDVAPASNELGAISDMAQQMYDLQEEIMKLGTCH